MYAVNQNGAAPENIPRGAMRSPSAAEQIQEFKNRPGRLPDENPKQESSNFPAVKTGHILYGDVLPGYSALQ